MFGTTRRGSATRTTPRQCRQLRSMAVTKNTDGVGAQGPRKGRRQALKLGIANIVVSAFSGRVLTAGESASRPRKAFPLISTSDPFELRKKGNPKKFVNVAKYKDLDAIARTRPAHFAYADRLRAQGRLAVGGPLLDDKGRRIGLLFVYEAVSKDAALVLAEKDPFTLANALSSYEVTEWRLCGVNLNLLVKANRSADQRIGRNTPIRLFANYAKYDTGKSKLTSVVTAHREYDRRLKNSGKLALAGSFANDEGGLFVYSTTGREEAMSWLKQDPFAVESVFADYELLEWLIEGINPDLLANFSAPA